MQFTKIMDIKGEALNNTADFILELGTMCTDVELEKICIPGIDNTYVISNVKKEFRKAVDEPWKEEPPWRRYQQKLIEDLAVLEQEKERAIDLQQFEKLIITVW